MADNVVDAGTPAYQGDGTCGCLACVDWSGVHGRCRAWPRKGDTCTDPWGFGCQCNDGGGQECEGCWLYGK
jgi:hypothetical protein